jgi:tRNA nucleotidyltransferase (CCA-adding enzyme)
VIDLTTGERQDPFEGHGDIRLGAVRMIEARNFQDDPLRMLRAVRLALQFDFTIEEKTVEAIRRSISITRCPATDRLLRTFLANSAPAAETRFFTAAFREATVTCAEV